MIPKLNLNQALNAALSTQTVKQFGAGAIGACLMYFPLNSINDQDAPQIQTIRVLMASTPLLLSLVGIGLRILVESEEKERSS